MSILAPLLMLLVVYAMIAAVVGYKKGVVRPLVLVRIIFVGTIAFCMFAFLWSREYGEARETRAVWYTEAPVALQTSPESFSVDIKVNGSDRPLLLVDGERFSYSWDGTGIATACTLMTPLGLTGISTAGSDGPIDPSHPWYPEPGRSILLTFQCEDAGGNVANDSVLIMRMERRTLRGGPMARLFFFIYSGTITHVLY